MYTNQSKEVQANSHSSHPRKVKRAISSKSMTAQAQLLQMQRQYGNRAVQKMLVRQMKKSQDTPSNVPVGNQTTNNVVQRSILDEWDEISKFNLSRLSAGSGVNRATIPTSLLTAGSITTAVPRMPGELVPITGQQTPPNALLGDYGQDNQIYQDSDRAGASGRLRSNTEAYLSDQLNRRIANTNGSNQAQHVVPFSLFYGQNRSFNFPINTEHPYNSQLLPEKSLYEDYIKHFTGPIVATYSNGLYDMPVDTYDSNAKNPQNATYRPPLGSYHQGYHSAYSSGIENGINEIATGLGNTNNGQITNEMWEASIFHMMRGGRRYAANQFPLYRNFGRNDISNFIHPHYPSYAVQELHDIGDADSVDQNKLLSKFTTKMTLRLGQ